MPAPTESEAPVVTKSGLKLPMITSTSKEAARKAALNYAVSFQTDPVVRWLCCPSSASRPNLLSVPDFAFNMWHITTRQETSNAGIVTNIDGDWDAVGIYFVPGTTDESMLGVLASSMLPTFISVIWHMGARLTWRAAVTRTRILTKWKKNYFLPERLKQHDFYVIACLATLEAKRSQGLGSAWVRWVQAKATEDGKPIWLETSTVRAKAMYERCGFWTVDEETLGAGEVDVEGWSVKKGREGEGHEATGVKFWALVWWPPGVKEERRQKTGEGVKQGTS